MQNIWIYTTIFFGANTIIWIILFILLKQSSDKYEASLTNYLNLLRKEVEETKGPMLSLEGSTLLQDIRRANGIKSLENIKPRDSRIISDN